MSVNGIQIIDIMKKLSSVMEENKLFLSELDAAIGDGDHGLNMNKGFIAVVDKLSDDDGGDIGNIFKKTGMALVSNVGGASGPLYGTAFMKAAAPVNGKGEMDIKDFLSVLVAALDGIKMRGKARAGEKTMIDAIDPAIESLRKSIENKEDSIRALEGMKDAAMEGVEYTKGIKATKGRASYLGDRSIGHQDAGATSSYLILNTIYEEIKRIKE